MNEEKKGFWKTIAGNVLNVAGDLTPIGGDALKNIGKKLLKKDNATADEIQNYLEEHPEAFQEYQTMLKEHEKQMYELENQRIKADLDSKISALQLEVQNKNNELTSVLSDVGNARTASLNLQTNEKVPYIQKITPSILAIVIVSLAFYFFYLIFKSELPSQNKEIIYVIVGFITSKFGDIIGFYYGSSDYLNQSGKLFNKTTK